MAMLMDLAPALLPSQNAGHAVSELVEELAVTQGTLHWLSKRGKEPYGPAYPTNLGATDLIGLRERLVDDLPE